MQLVVNQGFIRVIFLLKCFHSRDRKLQIDLFNTFVRSVLEYIIPYLVSTLRKRHVIWCGIIYI